LQVISSELLIVLKLYAGDSTSRTDIKKLLEANPNIDTSYVGQLALEVGLKKEWIELSAK